MKGKSVSEVTKKGFLKKKKKVNEKRVEKKLKVLDRMH